jgi:hypothetical protein
VGVFSLSITVAVLGASVSSLTTVTPNNFMFLSEVPTHKLTDCKAFFTPAAARKKTLRRKNRKKTLRKTL